MGDKRKGSIFLGIAVLVKIFQYWISPHRPFGYFDEKTYYYLLTLSILISLIYLIVLTLINFRDIEKFNQAGKSVRKVGAEFVIIFFVIIGITFTVTTFSLNYLGKYTNFCKFPRALDLIYHYEVSQRKGINSLYLNRGDLSCDFTWGIESIELEKTLTQEEIKRVVLVGTNSQNHTFILYQEVDLYDEVIQEKHINSLTSWLEDEKTERFFLNLPENQLKTKSYCYLDQEGNICFVHIFGDHTVMFFHFFGDNSIDFETHIISILDLASKRLIQFENN